MIERIVARGRVWCEFPGCNEPGCDVHEVLPRSAGGAIDDESNVAVLCRKHHDWVHANPERAMELGFKASRYE